MIGAWIPFRNLRCSLPSLKVNAVRALPLRVMVAFRVNMAMKGRRGKSLVRSSSTARLIRPQSKSDRSRSWTHRPGTE